jgi:glycine oxidase
MDVVIVGGGVIGLSIAWQSLVRGANVTVIDPDPASQASRASAGMLLPVAEMLYHDDDLLRFHLDSRQRFTSFITELEAASGSSAGYSHYGFLDAAFDDEGLGALDKLRSFGEPLGVVMEPLSAADCRREEPRLAATVAGGMLVPDGGAVNPRQLTAALLRAVRELGGTLVKDRARDLLLSDRAEGVRLDSGAVIYGDRIVLAAGCWTHELGGLQPGTVPRIRPFKGQVLRFRAEGQFLRRATRAAAGGSSVYLVPRPDGEFVVGATYEEAGYDTSVTAEGMLELFGKMRAALASLAGLEFTEAIAGLRPAAPDDLPVLGMSSVPGLIVAAGHGRMGIQLTPATAAAITALLFDGELTDVARPLSPDRFGTLV